MNEAGLPPLYLTAARLKAKGACGYQVHLFLKTFGRGKVLVTKENWLKASKAGMQLCWVLRRYHWRINDIRRDKGLTRLPFQLTYGVENPEALWKLLTASRRRVTKHGLH